MVEQQGFFSQSRSLSSLETWFRALTQPTEAGYSAIANDPKAGYRRAFVWLAASSFITYAVAALYIFSGGPGYFTDPTNPYAGFSLYSLLCLGPVAVIGALISVGILAGVSQLVARMLGGSGSYETLYYTFSAYLAPVGLISFVLNTVPYLACLNLPLGLFALYLNVVAVKTVHRFGWGRAFFSSVAIILFLLTLVAVCAIALLAMMGPAIGTVFSNIIQAVGTPLP